MKGISYSRRRFLLGDRHFSDPTIRIGPACFGLQGIVCQSCGDACPEVAISFWPRAGAPTLPIIAKDRCNGCAACVAACPAGAISAMPRSNEAHHV